MFKRVVKMYTSILTVLASPELTKDRENAEKCHKWSQKLVSDYPLLKLLLALLEEPYRDTEKISSRKFLISEVGNVMLWHI